MTQKETAEYLGTTVGTLNTWRHYGKDKIPFVRWGNRIRYCKEDMDVWIQTQIAQPNNHTDFVISVLGKEPTGIICSRSPTWIFQNYTVILDGVWNK